MARELYIDGVLIPEDGDNVVIDGVPMIQLNVDGDTVWEKVTAPLNVYAGQLFSEDGGTATGFQNTSLVYGDVNPRVFPLFSEPAREWFVINANDLGTGLVLRCNPGTDFVDGVSTCIFDSPGIGGVGPYNTVCTYDSGFNTWNSPDPASAAWFASAIGIWVPFTVTFTL